jgi:endonuclease/exonuclease/phosphatase family metal-dependent hydrolase
MQAVRFRVLTYNIHKGFSAGNRRLVLHRIREELRNTGADIAFFQEIHGQHTEHGKNIEDWPSSSQFEFLADEVWPHYAYGRNAIYAEGHHGNAILSKYPFHNWQNINISSMQRASRSILHGIVEFPEHGNRLHVICVHLDILGYERKRQLGILNNHIQKCILPHEPVILAGDFNDWRGQVTRLLDSSLQLLEVFMDSNGRHAKTYPAWCPMFQVDRIYYRGVRRINSTCLDQEHWKSLSDHLPLQAEFELLL